VIARTFCAVLTLAGAILATTVARAETLTPTPAGMLSPLVGALMNTLGPATMSTVRLAVSAPPSLFTVATTTIAPSVVSVALTGWR